MSRTWRLGRIGLVYVLRGVIIDNIYIKDIQLTRDLQDALSSAATEQR